MEVSSGSPRTPAPGKVNRSPWLTLTLMLGNLVGLGAVGLATPAQAHTASAHGQKSEKAFKAGLADLAIGKDSFTARYDGAPVSGTIGAGRTIGTLNYGEASLAPSCKIKIDDLAPLMKRLDSALGLIVAEPSLKVDRKTPLAMSTVDGHRFEFDLERDKASRSFVATASDLCAVIKSFGPEDQAKLARARVDVDKLVAGIGKDLRESVPAESRSALAARGKRAWMMERVEAVETSMAGYIEARKLHPISRGSWERYRADFREKTGPLCRALDRSVASGTEIETTASSLDRKLKEYEAYLGITPRPEGSFSPYQAVMIIERLERSANINDRFAAIEKRLKEEGNGLRPEERAKLTEEIAKKRESIQEMFGKPSGWERWDPLSLPQADHRGVIEKLDAWASGVEKKLGLSASPNGEIRERCEKRLEDLEKAQQGLADLEKRKNARELLDLRGGISVVERQDLGKPHLYDRHRSKGDWYQREWFDDGRVTYRSESSAPGRETMTSFDKTGAVSVIDEWSKADGKWRLDRKTEYLFDRSYSVSDAATISYEVRSSGKNLVGKVEYAKDAKTIAALNMYDAKGEAFGNFQDERAKNAKLTASQYLDLLAKKLDTPQKIHVFLDLFMQYTSDDERDVWQPASTTLQRTDNRKMLGDCDDYAFLVRDILRRQGISAEVLCIPTPPHALCVWVEKRADGRYDAHAICTYGYDRNGNRHGLEPDAAKSKGYATVIEAMQSLMEKYKDSGTGVTDGAVYRLSPSSMQVLDLSPEGWKVYRQVGVSWFTPR